MKTSISRSRDAGLQLAVALALIVGFNQSDVLAQTSSDTYFYDTLVLPDTEYEQIFAVDWNGDSRVDLVTYNAVNDVHTLTVFPQLADTTLGDPTIVNLPINGLLRPRLYLVDLNGNGRPEIITSLELPIPNSDTPIEIGVQDNAGNVSAPFQSISQSSNWQSLHFEDLNNDGLLEIFAAELVDPPHVAATVSIWLFTQDSALDFSSELKRENLPPADHLSPAFSDVNDDGLVDYLAHTPFYQLNGEGTVDIFFGSQNYDFQEFTLLPTGESERLLVVADIDADGRSDMLLSGQHRLMVGYQRVDGTFLISELEDVAARHSSTMAVVDLDDDGDMDIIGFESGSYVLQNYLQMSSRSFLRAPPYVVRSDPPFHGFPNEGQNLIADLNSDGKVDVVAKTLNAPGIGYNRLGVFSVADAALSIDTSFEFRDDGSITTYVVKATNIGDADVQNARVLLRISDHLTDFDTDKTCSKYLAIGQMDTEQGTVISRSGLICEVGSLAVGTSYELTIKTKSTSEGYYESLHAVVGEIEVLEQVDANPDNNTALGSIQGISGNRNFFDVPYDTLFVNESSGQLLVTASRSGASLTQSWIDGEYIYDTAVRDDFDPAEYQFFIDFVPGNSGPGRALININNQDGDEGAEQANLRVDAPWTEVTVNIRDDLTGISSSGAEPFAAGPSPYESIQLLPVTSESVAGVAGDFNGDGYMDFAIAEGFRNSDRGFWLEMYAGSVSGFAGQPTARISRSARPTDIVSGDFNNDGQTDLLVADAAGLQIFIDDGLGGLTEGQYLPGPMRHSVAVADLDKNGTDDVVAIRPNVSTETNYQTLRIYLQDTSGALAASQTLAVPNSGDPTVVIADVNNDGRPDIVTDGRGLSDLNFLLQEPDGSYGAPILRKLTGPAGEFGSANVDGLTSGDIDNDGIVEMLPFGAGAVVNGLLYGSSDTVEPLPMWRNLEEFIAHDMNNDGLLDLISNTSIDYGQLPAVHLQSADGSYHLVVAPDYNGEGLLNNGANKAPWFIADLNGDGTPDVVTIGISRQPHNEPISAMIGFNWPEFMNMSTSIQATSGSTSQIGNGSVTVRVTNEADVNAGESTLVLSSSSNTRINDAYAAVGTCGLLQSNRRNAVCKLPRLGPGGHVDIKISYEVTSTGTVNVTSRIEGLREDATPSNNTAIHSFNIASPAPPPKKGGGGSTGLYFILFLMSFLLLRQRWSPGHGPAAGL